MSQLPQSSPSSLPIYRQLYERLRSGILTGQLAPGDRLPSTRVMAKVLGVSRNTATAAIELLQVEGLVRSEVGSGTRVSTLPGLEASRQAGRAPGTPKRIREGALSKEAQRILSTPFPETAYGKDALCENSPFLVGMPDTNEFPRELWARTIARLARRSFDSVAPYQAHQGVPELRLAIAVHIAVSRGVRCWPEQIIVTAGAQGALYLAARALIDPGEAASMEDPGYTGARLALIARGARVCAVPVDAHGITIPGGLADNPPGRMTIVTPSHQFPTSVTMPLARRRAVLDWAASSGGLIVEDDYDSEYRYSGAPVEALQAMDESERVIYVGTFSKTMYPSLRVGYLVLPPGLVDSFLATRITGDLHPPVLEQLALAEFMSAGHYARHLRRMRQHYLERRDVLVHALTETLGDLLEPSVPEVGMHLVAWLTTRGSAEPLAQRASLHGVHALPVSRFSARRLSRDGLVLGFSSARPEELRAGVRTLGIALRNPRGALGARSRP
ncbi:MAG TPA: PLP-dependent aminotransferase family protein [Spirochaetia bacterium]|nr:PLP-dependent aminotransferase family protein [Spirochaetia bacterium]